MKKTAVFVAVVFALSAANFVSADIVIDNFTDETNDRFTNSNSFIGDGLDFSGVGRDNRWGTLISPNVLITAAHFNGNGEYHFYPGNDETATPVIRNRVAGQRIGSSDLFLVALDRNVTPDITFYNFATEPLSAPAFDPMAGNNIFNAGSLQNEVAFIFGISPTNRSNSRVDQAVGRNRITGYVENIDFLGNTDNDSILFQRDNPGDADYVENEALVQGGDSGAPVFIERNGELLLLGINSFRADDSSFSGITYTGNLASEINNFIAINAVPEPSAGAVLATLGLAAFVRRRRRG